MSGFFVSVLSMTWPLRVLSYVSPLRFLFQGTLLNEFSRPARYTVHCTWATACLFDPSLKCVFRVPPGSPLALHCDPAVRHRFEQDKVWINFVASVLLAVGWYCAALAIFVAKNRERKARRGFDGALEEQFLGSKGDGAVSTEDQLPNDSITILGESEGDSEKGFE